MTEVLAVLICMVASFVCFGECKLSREKGCGGRVKVVLFPNHKLSIYAVLFKIFISMFYSK